MKRFALIGAAGYIAPKHMKAIRDTGNQLVAASDPHDSVGVLDTYAPGCRMFVDNDRLDRHLYRLKRSGQGVDYVSVCSPNYLHDAHCRLAMRNGADVICEKPLVLKPWNLDQLADLERETGRRVWTVLQLRLNPALVALKDKIAKSAGVADVQLFYATPRGPWYGASWKGDAAKSGGVLANVGVHMFDLLAWLFGPPRRGSITDMTATKATGEQQHDLAGRVTWRLTLDHPNPKRTLTVNGEALDLSDGFVDAHTKVYAETLAGRGWGLEDARPAIEWIDKLKTQWGV